MIEDEGDFWESNEKIAKIFIYKGVEKDRAKKKTNGMGFFWRERENENRRKGERRGIDTEMILFGARMKSMTEGLNSISDIRAVVGKTVAPRG